MAYRLTIARKSLESKQSRVTPTHPDGMELAALYANMPFVSSGHSMLRSTIPFFIIGSAFASSTALAQIPPAQAPDVTALFASDTFALGQSSAVGSALIKYATSYALTGPKYGNPAKVYNPCTLSPNPSDWELCDELRIGSMIGPQKTCDETMTVLIDPQEDGAFLVKNRLNNIQTESGKSYCDNYDIRPHDSTMRLHARYHFPNGTTASAEELDRYWVRPRLRFMTIGEIPQDNAGVPGDRVLKALRRACYDLDGAGGILPAVPTWVMFERKPDHEAFGYASLLAAAGGTGSACYPSTRAACDDVTPCGAGEVCGSDGLCVCDPTDPAAPTIDVCSHIEDGRTDATLRADLASGLYGFGPGDSDAAPGLMGFGESNANNGQSKYLECHLAGNNAPACDTNGGEPVPTDLLGTLSCVRQLPRGIVPEDAYIVYCTDPNNQASCTVLSEADGNIEWLDSRKTLFLAKGVDCRGISVTECKPGAYCDTGLGGRCSVGQIGCSTGFEVCEPLFSGFPEICNGLDDDCDGRVDNMKESWEKSDHAGYTLPSDHAGLDCNRVDVCMCPDGETDNHSGANFSAYLDGWDAVCQCGEGLGADSYAPAPESELDSEPQASCAAVGSDDAVPAIFLGLIALGFAPLLRRRKR